jgi:hypothetical protein
MKVWILTIQILNSSIEYKYKFLERSNCEKVGNQTVGNSKQMGYSCRLRKVKIPKR